VTRTVAVGGVEYRIEASQREGRWTAIARRTDTAARQGPPVGGASEDDAVTRMTAWLEWQHEHTVALEALQQAERAYQRIIAGSAFLSGPEGPSSIELQKEALARLEDARLRLDEVRQRKPE